MGVAREERLYHLSQKGLYFQKYLEFSKTVFRFKFPDNFLTKLDKKKKKDFSTDFGGTSPLNKP